MSQALAPFQMPDLEIIAVAPVDDLGFCVDCWLLYDLQRVYFTHGQARTFVAHHGCPSTGGPALLLFGGPTGEAWVSFVSR